MSVSRQLVLPSSPPVSQFYEGDIYSDAGGRLEQAKARIRAKVEHPFRVIKRPFGYTKVKYRGLAKKTANLVTLFALSNLWMARRSLLQGVQG